MDGDWLADQFEANRPHLRAVAYRILGSTSEAEDAVQEAWLRLSRADSTGVQNLGGWLTTVVGRVCLDMLRSRKSRREELLGEQVAETVVGREDQADPEHQALLDGAPGAVWLAGGRPLAAFTFKIVGDKIVAIDMLGDPDRLEQLDVVLLNP